MLITHSIPWERRGGEQLWWSPLSQKRSQKFWELLLWRCRLLAVPQPRPLLEAILT